MCSFPYFDQNDVQFVHCTLLIFPNVVPFNIFNLILYFNFASKIFIAKMLCTINTEAFETSDFTLFVNVFCQGYSICIGAGNTTLFFKN